MITEADKQIQKDKNKFCSRIAEMCANKARPPFQLKISGDKPIKIARPVKNIWDGNNER
jgi:hypothetical protein